MQQLKQMTLKEKIAQLYLIDSTGNFAEMAEAVSRAQVGGVLLFGKDLAGQTQSSLQKECREYQRLSRHGLFIAIDQEGGLVDRLSASPAIAAGHAYPSPAKIYQESGHAGLRKEAAMVAKQLKTLGINWNFAPVADVADDPSSFIYERTLKASRKESGRFVAETCQIYQDCQVASSLKHFPGYGNAGDTHTGVGVSRKSKTAFYQDLEPFKQGIRAGAWSIMVSHLIVSCLDPAAPASLSVPIHDFIRQDLNYDGIILTDDLQMDAAKEYAKAKGMSPDLLALLAGNDILLGGNWQTGIPALVQAVRNGQLTEARIDQSVARVLQLKARLGILK